MKKKSIKMQSTDPDIIASLPAMRRAARAARKLAEATGSPFYVMKNGKIVDLNPQPKGKKKPKINRLGLTLLP